MNLDAVQAAIVKMGEVHGDLESTLNEFPKALERLFTKAQAKASGDSDMQTVWFRAKEEVELVFEDMKTIMEYHGFELDITQKKELSVGIAGEETVTDKTKLAEYKDFYARYEYVKEAVSTRLDLLETKMNALKE